MKVSEMLAVKTQVRKETIPLNLAATRRRATQGFNSDPIPDAILKELFELALLAPSGYNLQPWRFVAVTELEDRKKLRQAAMGQQKVEEAPVVVIACADPTAWRNDLERMLDIGRQLGSISDDNVATTMRKHATKYLESIDNKIWATKQTMIAFTQLMLLAETYGLDTAPMEGFWEDKVKKAFNIPEHFLVLALLAIGYANIPDRPFGGRFDLSDLVSLGAFGKPLTFS